MAARDPRVPYPVIALLCGLALALCLGSVQLRMPPNLVLGLFLPILLFHGAASLDLAMLRQEIGPVTLLVVLGVLATTGAVGAVVHATAGFSWAVALLCGALVAPTDPAAVLAIVGPLGVDRRLTTIVNAESLFNDGVALVLFGLLLWMITSPSLTPGAAFARLGGAVVGALALGIAIGLAGRAVRRGLDNALLDVALTVFLAYGGYLLATQVAASGPLEIVITGLVMGTTPAPPRAERIWSGMAVLATVLLFLTMGLSLPAVVSGATGLLGLRVWMPLVATLVAVLGVRALLVRGVGLLPRHGDRPLPPGASRILLWAGLRGAVSLAAALSLPSTLPHRLLLVTVTCNVVLFTLIVQGTTMRLLLPPLPAEGHEDMAPLP